MRRLVLPRAVAGLALGLSLATSAHGQTEGGHGSPQFQSGQQGRAWARNAYAPGPNSRAEAMLEVMQSPQSPQTPQRPPDTEPVIPEPDTGAPPAPEAPTPTTPEPSGTAALGPEPGAAAAAAAAADTGGLAAAPFSGLGGGLGAGESGVLNMLGDLPPQTARLLFPNVGVAQVRPPSPPGLPPPEQPPQPGRPQPVRELLQGAALVPTVRGFKVADNQSPMPINRVYFAFNYFNDLNGDINARFGSPLYDMNVYRYLLGFEKTFLDGRGSFGMRIPLNNLSTKSFVPPLAGTTSSLGDLAVILKYAFYWNRETNNLFSGGLLVSAPTGNQNFAGYGNIRYPHYTAIQPWMGYLINRGRFYAHGFSSIDVPTGNDVTMIYNDFGLGYFLYRTTDASKLLRVVAPTFEVHVNTPVNHRDWRNPFDIAGTPDFVNFTYGVTLGIGRRGFLTTGYVAPVTGPRPFTGELMAYFNLYF